MPVGFGARVQLLRVLVGSKSLQGHETLHGPRILRVAGQDLEVCTFSRAILTRSKELPRPFVFSRVGSVIEARGYKGWESRKKFEDRCGRRDGGAL
jgi:hypothetical protein